MARHWTPAERKAQSKRMKEIMTKAQHEETRIVGAVERHARMVAPASNRLQKFAEHMDKRNYGYEQIVNAMEWYLLGWDDSRVQK